MTTPSTTVPKGRLWTGRIISILIILFMLFDAITKIIHEQHTIDACNKMGWPINTLTPMGIVLLISTFLYALPKTAVFGAVLLTAWLGGATAEMVRLGNPVYFSVVFGILAWLGLWLKEPRLSDHLPVKKG